MGSTISVGHFPSSLFGGHVVAQSLSLSHPAVLKSISLHVVKPAGDVYLGIYNAAGELQATTALFTPRTGWNTRGTPQVTLTKGRYWLAFHASSNDLQISHTHKGRWQSLTQRFGPLPQQFVATEHGAGSWELFATLTPAGALI